ncbi:hypothetical protein CEXT_572471, partial [Caerostris extrusa]
SWALQGAWLTSDYAKTNGHQTSKQNYGEVVGVHERKAAELQASVVFSFSSPPIPTSDFKRGDRLYVIITAGGVSEINQTKSVAMPML